MEETNDMTLVPQTQIASADDLEFAIKTAERNEELARKIKIIAIRQTTLNDWVNMGGKAYPQSSGSEKIANLFGVSWRICEGYPKKETISDENGSYYMYTYKGEFFMGKRSIEMIGTCSQKDDFLGTQGNKNRPLSEIDECDIIKKANTNMIGRGVTTILGIRNLTWEEVEQALGTGARGKTASVNYKTSTEQETEGKITSGGKKSGEGKKGPWTQYYFEINGLRVSTFDSKIGDVAISAKQNNQTVKITYKNDGKYNNAETIEIITEEPIEGRDHE